MRTYETTFIINPQTDDATIDKFVTQVADIITGSKGKILHQENMGTRRLAYEINGLTQGFYANFVYQAPQETIPKLDRHFKLNEVYIRNLTVRFDGDPEEIFQKKDVLNKQGDANSNESKEPPRTQEKETKFHKNPEPENDEDMETADSSEENSEDETPTESDSSKEEL